jgi:hypothetical protein
MFGTFQKSFSRDAVLSIGNAGHIPPSEVIGLNNLIDRFGGTSFEGGLYRVIRALDVSEWNDRIARAFPEFGGRITCFGFDWLGRVFAIDPKRSEQGQPGVVMFEPGTGKALEIPCAIGTFHDEELMKYGDAALAIDFYTRWLENGGAAPQYGECIGYRKPLFLGGADELSNLETSDVDVYWHIIGQLILKAKGLPPDTPIHVSL